MLVALVTVILLAAGSPQASERSRAEDLARSGRSAEALEIFKQIAERDPADTDAQIWIARLDLRLGRADEAEARFRQAVSPLVSWDRDRTRLDARYSYTRSEFEATGQSSGDHRRAQGRRADVRRRHELGASVAVERHGRRSGDNVTGAVFPMKGSTE